jgi:uncharacterized protein (TIGR04551 family)
MLPHARGQGVFAHRSSLTPMHVGVFIPRPSPYPWRITVTVHALAALLVSATALAQTSPPPGAPLAEPKLRTDADIQREIDAKVEAAKKELREEMRAQSATAAATSAGTTWEAEATSHRKLDLFEPHGYFRVRPELFHKFDLGQPADAAGYTLFPRPDTNVQGTSGGHTIAGVNTRFRFEPTLNISEEVRIRSQIDALDNLVWGSTPQYAYIRQDRVDIGILNGTQVPNQPGVNSSQSNLAVKRVWGEVATPLGLLRFGRMGDQFGLGIVHNDGNCLDCDYGTTVDRFQFVAEPLPGFYIVPTFDFDVEGLVSGRTGDPGQPYDLTQSDDSHTFGIVLARKDTDQKARVKLESGGAVFNYGLYFQYRSQHKEYTQNGSTTSYTDSDPSKTTPVGNPSNSATYRDAYLFIPDIWIKFERKHIRIELEAAAYLGKVDVCDPTKPTIGACTPFGRVTIAQFGGALQTEYRILEGALKFGLEVGAASGDSAPGFGNKPNRSPNLQSGDAHFGAQWNNYEGAQYGRRACTAGSSINCDDRDIRNFRFNQDYRIDLILWREIIGGITDALYVKPSVKYNFSDALGIFGSVIYSKALKPESTPSGISTQLGVEIDAGVRYETDDGFWVQLAYGVLFPFDGLQNNYFGTSVVFSTTVAQAIRAQLGIRF